ncbi:MAG TPA: tRNA (adenosine(37)-N6)-threonylcarbamoyltransferase complex dimerization subunit type 1 TsaB [Patescibacteria group bacterium]|nr:tRNA (adenosine(37)-N6)-threonylcarbamoyltransferase complex dimerization subunit type 1 TsaB [Patescibacteria group bacterium]
MLILTIRTDRPEAEVGLFEDHIQLAYETWLAHRELSITIHNKIENLLAGQNKTFQDIKGIICFAGPGSFTGLRIGITVGNALAYGLQIPIVARKDPDWLHTGINNIAAGDNDKISVPEYGAPVHITQPKK